jgi:diacylglycerol kinase family enzyme
MPAPADLIEVERMRMAAGAAGAGEGLVVVINADAGRVRSLGPKSLRGLVRRYGPTDLARVITTDRHDLRDCLLEAAHAAPRAIAIIGGDGTAHSAIETLTPLGVPAVPLPGGTMNRLAARVFGRAKLEHCVSALEGGEARHLAGGRVGGRSFFVAAGFGGWMQVQSLRERLRKPKSIAGLRALLRMAPRQFADRVSWTVGEAAPLSHTTLIVGVGRIDTAFGFGLERHEPALLEAAGADIRDWGDLAWVAGAAALRRWRRLKRVTALSTRALTIESNHEGTPTLLDGEFHMLGRVNALSFEPKLGLVWTPARRVGPW